MSKIGKQPIAVPENVKVNIVDSQVEVSGPKGTLTLHFHPQVDVKFVQDELIITSKSESKFAKSLHGLTRSLVANMVKGVTDGHQKTLEIIGVGYRATKQEDNLVLNVGYSHPVIITPLPTVQCEIKENKIIVSGADKALVGETAARIRRVRPPEPYKGKGIKYADEIIRRKAGKALKTTQGAS